MLRRDLIQDKKLGSDFEFSQSYIFFWDKLERMNYNIQLLRKWKKEECDMQDRKVQHVLKDPFCDGAQWVMFENLVRRYGVVPKDVYPESVHSSNTRGLNMVLCQMFRQYATQIMTTNDYNVGKMLDDTYLLLVKLRWCWMGILTD